MRRHPRVVVGVLVVLALVAVVAALGGFARETPDDGVEVAAPGDEIEATPFRVRLDRAEAVYELDGRLAEEGLAYLVVDGTLSVDGDESVGSLTMEKLVTSDLDRSYDFFDNPSTTGEASHVEVAGDGSTLLGLGPGLAYDVRVVFSLEEGAVPDRLAVTLHHLYRRESTLDKSLVWDVGDESTRVTLDVAPLPDERPVEEDLL